MSTRPEIHPGEVGIFYQDWSDNDAWADLADSHDRAAIEELRKSYERRLARLGAKARRAAEQAEAASCIETVIPFEQHDRFMVAPREALQSVLSNAS